MLAEMQVFKFFCLNLILYYVGLDYKSSLNYVPNLVTVYVQLQQTQNLIFSTALYMCINKSDRFMLVIYREKKHFQPKNIRTYAHRVHIRYLRLGLMLLLFD